jgi:hypothetical protein
MVTQNGLFICVAKLGQKTVGRLVFVLTEKAAVGSIFPRVNLKKMQIIPFLKPLQKRSSYWPVGQALIFVILKRKLYAV